MPVPLTSILDSGTGVNANPVGTPWTTAPSWTNGLERNTNQFRNSTPGSFGGSYWNTAYGPNLEHYATLAVAPLDNGEFAEIDLLVDPTAVSGGAAQDGYSFYITTFGGATSAELAKFTDGVVSLLATTGALTGANAIANGDAFMIRRVGDLVQGWLRRSGVWALALSVNDTTYQVPLTGILGCGDADGSIRLTNWGGGTINSGGGLGTGWAFRSVSSVATGTTSLSITKPTGTADNDLLVMCLSHKGAGYATVPAGWTLIARNISGSTRGEMYWKRAATEGSSYSITGLADTACGFIVAYQGGILNGSPVVTSASAANPSGTETAPSVTTTAYGQMVIVMVAVGANNAVTIPPASDTDSLSFDEIQDGGTANGTDSRIQAAHVIPPEVGATGAIGYGITNAESVAISVVLAHEPVPAGGDIAIRFYPTLIAPNERIYGFTPGTWSFTAPILNGLGWGTDTCFTMRPEKTLGGSKDDATLRTNQQGNVDHTFEQYNTPPLAAQTVSGTFNMCLGGRCSWETPSTQTTDTHVCFKVHVAIMVGQTGTVRQVLLDNYADTSNEWLRAISGNGRWQSLASAQTLTAGTVQEGDTIRVVVGYRVVSSPTPAPIYPSEPFVVDTNNSVLVIRGGRGTTHALMAPGHIDAVNGTTSTTDMVGWFEFSGGLTLS
jgi:hypothetical protein